MRRCRRYEKAHPQEQKPLIIKYCKDDRYDENLFSTHDGKVKHGFLGLIRKYHFFISKLKNECNQMQSTG